MRNVRVRHIDWFFYNIIFLIQHIIGYEKIKKRTLAFYDKLEKEKRISNRIDGVFISSNEQDIFNSKIVLLKGYAKDWKCVKKWDLDFFKKEYGNQQISLINTKGLVDEQIQPKCENISLSQYIDELKNGSKKYLKLSDLVNKNKSLQNDINYDWLDKMTKKGSLGRTYYSFIGGKGTKTPMHSEFPINIYIQVWGKKKWILYPPNNHIFLNAITERKTYFLSEAIPEDENNPSVPLLKYGDKIEIILDPGDILLVPPFTWHYVENLTDSIAVAYKYANVVSAFKSSKLFTVLSFLSTKPSIFYSFIMTRIQKKDSIIN